MHCIANATAHKHTHTRIYIDIYSAFAMKVFVRSACSFAFNYNNIKKTEKKRESEEE